MHKFIRYGAVLLLLLAVCYASAISVLQFPIIIGMENMQIEINPFGNSASQGLSPGSFVPQQLQLAMPEFQQGQGSQPGVNQSSGAPVQPTQDPGVYQPRDISERENPGHPMTLGEFLNANGASRVVIEAERAAPGSESNFDLAGWIDEIQTMEAVEVKYKGRIFRIPIANYSGQYTGHVAGSSGIPEYDVYCKNNPEGIWIDVRILYLNAEPSSEEMYGYIHTCDQGAYVVGARVLDLPAAQEYIVSQ